MDNRIVALANSLQEKTVACRRDFHRYAESGWTEFRTSAKVADALLSLGYEVLVGDDVVAAEHMMGVPTRPELETHMARAIAQGANPTWVEKMQGGKTGVLGVMRFGKPGATVAFRFDIDANDIDELQDATHRPYREGFSSVNKGAMHACGHDGHTATGLALAEILAVLKSELTGTVKLIFQPAEEGVRGGKAMAKRGITDDVDYLIGIHLGINLKRTGQLACKTEGLLATTKIDATFTGAPAHPTASPEKGRNALLAAAMAALNLHAIPRHGQGGSWVHVGVLNAGTGRNVVPPNAVLKFETRGVTTEINDYAREHALRVIEGAAKTYNVGYSWTEAGSAVGCESDAMLAERVRETAERMGLFTEILPAVKVGFSEDFTYFMDAVQKHGGKAVYAMIGTDYIGHHNSNFDFDEAAMVGAVALLGGVAADLL